MIELSLRLQLLEGGVGFLDGDLRINTRALEKIKLLLPIEGS